VGETESLNPSRNMPACCATVIVIGIRFFLLDRLILFIK
jgi:hypothetical protein